MSGQKHSTVHMQTVRPQPQSLSSVNFCLQGLLQDSCCITENMVLFFKLLHLQNNQVSSLKIVGTQLVHVPGHALLTNSTMLGDSTKASTKLKDHQVQQKP